MKVNNSPLIPLFKESNRSNSSVLKESFSFNQNFSHKNTNFTKANIKITTYFSRERESGNDTNEQKENNEINFSKRIIDNDDEYISEKENSEKSEENKFKKSRNNQIKDRKKKIPDVNKKSKKNKNKLNDKKESSELSVLNDCYNKLTELISEYPFIEISKIILKLINDIAQEDNDNNILFKEIKKIISKMKNKGSITIMCLSILSSKINLNKDNDKDVLSQTFSQKKEENQKVKINKKYSIPKNKQNKLNWKNNIKKNVTNNEVNIKETMELIKASKENMELLIKKAKKYCFFYKNDEEEIFLYRCKNTINKEPFIYYCSKDKTKCRAIC